MLVENFKTGTMEKWGLGYETLALRFARLVYCRVTGFGADGPLGGLPGYDAAIQAMSGLMSVNGERDGGPLRVGLPVVDMTTGLNAVIGVLLALRARERSGRGQFVEAALYDSGLSLCIRTRPIISSRGATPYEPETRIPTSPHIPCSRQEARRSFWPLATTASSANCATSLRRGTWRTIRISYRTRCASSIATNCRLRLSASWRRTMARSLPKIWRAGVPCAPVLDVSQALAQPHTAHRDMVVEMGDYRGVGGPVKLSVTPATYRRPPPRFGEHTQAILQEFGIATVSL